jgi:cytochrome c oxidase subunit 2
MIKSLKSLIIAGGMILLAPVALAQAPAPEAAPVAAPVAAPAEAAPAAATPADAAPTDAAAAAPAAKGLDPALYVPMKPTEGKGMPIPGGVDFQDQYSEVGNQAKWMNNVILLPMITIISLFVLALLLYVVVRYRRAANPNPSKTTHNSVIEVIWTVIPVLILVVIAVPSIGLIAKQYKPAPADALTVKVTGYQWYWTYGYPDNGGFEVVSNMLPEEEAEKRGEPAQLAADNRMVIPVGQPVRLLVTAADVIHSFAVPSAWFKIDAVPGKINERVLKIDEPGVYYGQCSELCGARHGFMPITIEVLPQDKYDNWVRANGGTVKGEAAAEAPAADTAPAAATAAAPATPTTPAAAPAAAAGN